MTFCLKVESIAETKVSFWTFSDTRSYFFFVSLPQGLRSSTLLPILTKVRMHGMDYIRYITAS